VRLLPRRDGRDERSDVICRLPPDDVIVLGQLNPLAILVPDGNFGIAARGDGLITVQGIAIVAIVAVVAIPELNGDRVSVRERHLETLVVRDLKHFRVPFVTL